MRYAIISDIHANETALRAVLTDAADAGAEKIICLGDVLGYGPEPVQTLELVYRRVHVCLSGNHDDAVSGRFPVEDFTSFAAAAVERHRAELSQEAIDWLRHLPHTCEFSGFNGRSTGSFACAHGDFSDPKNYNYVLEPRDAMASWLERVEQLLFVGHTHKPGIFVLGASGEPHVLEPEDFSLEVGKRYVVNVGSVGYPRSGVCRSFYCLYDDEARSVHFRSLPFDIEGYREKMHGRGLDEAPWMLAREQERHRPEVRGAEQFGRKNEGGGCRTASVEERMDRGSASPREGARQERRPSLPLVIALGLGVVSLVLVGVWSLLRVLPRKSVEGDVTQVQVAPVEGEEATVVGDAAPAERGRIVDRRQCTIPTGGRLRFQVKLQKGSMPAWVHIRYENGNGEPTGDDLWYQNVRQSKKSPKRGGIIPPREATAAIIEVVTAHEGDVCEVAELVLEPFKEDEK